MNRRPWLGFGLSVALHAAVFGLFLVVFWRGDRLAALIVDLRENFVPRVASVRPPAPEARQQSARPPRRVPAGQHPPPPPTESAAAPVPETPPAEASPTPPPLPVEALQDSPRPASLPAVDPVLSAKPSPSVGAREAPARDSDSGAEALVRDSADVDTAATSSSSSSHRGRPVRGDGDGGGQGGRAVQALALATPGGGSGVGPEYGPYLAALRQRIQQSIRYPGVARRRGLSGTVNVEILILAIGVVGDVIVLDSSTHQALDDAALDTIRALPRMPLPPDVPARPLRIRVPVVFELR